MIPLGTNQALTLLGDKNPSQLKKLVLSNMLTDIRIPGSRNLKLDSDQVQALADYPEFHLKKKVRKETRVLALHLHPIEEWDGPDRPMWGYDFLNRDNLSAADQELAWVGYWPLDADRARAMKGQVIVGDVSGWIPTGLGRRVEDVAFTPDGVLFQVRPLADEEAALFTGKRFKSSRGPNFEFI